MGTENAYAKEKLFRMIYGLATGTEDIKTRLRLAFFDVPHIKKEIFTPVLQSEWEEISERVRRLGPIQDGEGKIVTGAFENTINHMTDDEAREIAEKIVNLYAVL